jgi:methionyl aminopeptidase
MPRRVIRTDEAPAPVAGAPYSQAIAASGGEVLWVSGQVPLDASGSLAADDVPGQTRQCLANVAAVVAAAGYGSPHDYCGHGIGRAMHEEPDVPNRGRRGKGPRLVAGSVLALEPMLIAGGHDDVEELDDGWTVVSADGSRCAHVEHTVLVTNRGPEILTRL